MITACKFLDSGISGAVVASVSPNDKLSDLGGDSISEGINIDAGNWIPFFEWGGSLNFPINSDSKPSITLSVGFSRTEQEVELFVAQTKTEFIFKKQIVDFNSYTAKYGVNMSCLKKLPLYGANQSCIKK